MRILFALTAAALVLISACARTEIQDHSTLAAGDNRDFSHERTTTANAAVIWTLWTDVTTWKDWDRGLKDARLDGVFAGGATGEIIPQSGPAAKFRVTEFVDGRSYAFETQLPFATLTVRRSLLSASPTVFRHEVSFEGALAWFWSGQLGPQFRAALPPTMDALAMLAEAEQKY